MEAVAIDRGGKRNNETLGKSLSRWCLCSNGGSLVITVVLCHQAAFVTIFTIGGSEFFDKLWSEYAHILSASCSVHYLKGVILINQRTSSSLALPKWLLSSGMNSYETLLSSVMVLTALEIFVAPKLVASTTCSANYGMINGLTLEDRNILRPWSIWTTFFPPSI